MELKPEMFKLLLPLPITLITTVNAEGVPNAAPYSCIMPVLRPLDLIAMASAIPRDTLRNILSTKQFVVNVMGQPGFEKAIACAANLPPGENELERAGLETLPSKEVKPPRVKDAIGWIEARLERDVVGKGYAVLIGKVLCAEINDAHLVDGKLKENPLVMLAPDFRSIGDKTFDREQFKEVLSKIRF